jgi:hypothetical protein
MARHFVLDGEEAPAPPYRPKKSEETDPELAKQVDSGKEFMDLFAQP